MTREELAKRIGESGYLKGSFTLRSGKVADHYFDKFALYAEPALLMEIALEMSKSVPDDTEVLAGIELGSIPLVTALSLATGLPAAFVRSKRKEYGTERIVEGANVTGKAVAMVEDVVSTGGSVLDALDALRGEGANVQAVLCLIYRGEGEPARLVEQGLTLAHVFAGEEIPVPQ